MILVDTSVWVDHLRSRNERLAKLLDAGRVATHPMVIGELACGSVRDRARFLSDLCALQTVACANHDEVLQLIERQKLWNRGLGWVDANLLASAAVSQCTLWTLDKSLHHATAALGVGWRR